MIRLGRHNSSNNKTMMSSSSGSNNDDANKEHTAAAVTASAAASTTTTTTTTMQTPPLLSLVEAMKAADRIRTIYVKRTKTERLEGETTITTTATATGTTATTPVLPPGVWAGSAAFLAVGVVCTPVRRRLLQHAVAARNNNHRQFHAFVDLLITPMMAILAAQTGIACFSLFGAKYYFDRVVHETTAASSTTTTNNNSIEELCHELVSITQTIPPSPPPPQQQQQQFVANTTNTNTTTTNSSTVVVQSSAAVVSPSASSWDPRVQTMNSLRMAIQNCQRIRTNNGTN